MLLKIIIIILIIILLSYSIIPTMIFKINHKINKKKINEKKLYLTFDDGPHSEYTSRLLDLLRDHNIQGTFFMVASFAKENPEIIERMKRENHVIGMHSYEHRNALYQSKPYTEYDFKESIKIMNELGVDVKYFRPPWGHYNIFTVLQCKKYNLIPVMWDVMAEDWEGNTIWEMIEEKLLLRSKNGSIICLHDGRGENKAPLRTIKALSEVIPMWKKEGYEFYTVEEIYE